ncbi:hypothetical protein AWZ03_001084 [Drosophila navojoa]|uniref:SH3 domain-containing protein n=1 Tax=Drosophila navojoa TaxID=7232 RepID=A0A484BUC4_DRONA|nr:hypothetical protein AWZ03_001084 [Drosophila navojoa]
MQFIAQLDDDDDDDDDDDGDETTFTLAAQSGEMRSSPKEIGAFNENGRNFVATKDTSRDFSNSQDNTDRGSMSDQAFACSASSVESLPSASGSSTQALVRPGSPHSSISAEDRASLASICKAKALVDSLPNPYDKEALKFKKGDLIDVLSMNASGIWKGRCHGRVGHFKFINVEVLPEQRMKNSSSKTLAPASRLANSNNGSGNAGPSTVEDLLIRIGLKEYTSVFVLNGYEDLELFKELEPADLDYLGILNQEHRAKLLTAVQLLHDIECSDMDIAGSSSENDEARLNNINKKHGASPFGRRHFPRDSGCYEGSPLPSSQTPTQTVNSTDDSNSLDDVVSKCSSEIMKRVESARRCKENPFKATLPARVGKKSFLGGGSLMGDDTLTRGGLSEKSSDSGLLLGVGQVGGGSSVGATSPTTSVASAGMLGCPSGGIGNAGLNVAAPLGNICNTLPHAPSGGSSTMGLASNLPLNRNLVMLRNHLRKNTSGNASAALQDDKDQ